MYRCNNCEAEFDTPKTTKDPVPYGSREVTYPGVSCCPFCGGDFEEVQICTICGDSFTESKFDGVCPGCINIISNRFSELIKANFTSFEVDILISTYDGRNIQ